VLPEHLYGTAPGKASSGPELLYAPSSRSVTVPVEVMLLNSRSPFCAIQCDLLVPWKVWVHSTPLTSA
jgi:hypothetical protein